MLSRLLFTRFTTKTLLQAAVFAIASFIFCAASILKPLVDIDELSDIGNYFSFWSELSSTSLWELFVRYEPGFVLFCKLCETVFSFSAFMWLVQFAVFYSMFLLASRCAQRTFVAALLSIVCLLYYLPISSMATLVIRQGLATAIFFCFLARYHGTSVRLFTAMRWVGVMALFHYSSAFVFIAIVLLPYARGMRAFYIWCVAMALYCFDLSGQVGIFLYSVMGLNVATLNALSVGLDYEVGFKVSFLLLNTFYVVLPAVLVMVGAVKVPIRAIFADDLFRLYFMLNALATVFSLLPFYDRFFMWSWAIGPVMLLTVLSPRRKLVSERPGAAPAECV